MLGFSVLDLQSIGSPVYWVSSVLDLQSMMRSISARQKSRGSTILREQQHALVHASEHAGTFMLLHAADHFLSGNNLCCHLSLRQEYNLAASHMTTASGIILTQHGCKPQKTSLVQSYPCSCVRQLVEIRLRQKTVVLLAAFSVSLQHPEGVTSLQLPTAPVHQQSALVLTRNLHLRLKKD